MPRKHRQPKAHVLRSMRELFVWQWLDFRCGWAPRTPGQPASPGSDDWTTYADFLAAYLAIRPEFRATRWGADPNFAERLLLAVEAGEDAEAAGARLYAAEFPLDGEVRR